MVEGSNGLIACKHSCLSFLLAAWDVLLCETLQNGYNGLTLVKMETEALNRS